MRELTECTFDPCDRNALCGGLCSTHYQQKKNGNELKPIRRFTRIPQPTPDTKVCTECMTVKGLSEFYMTANGVLRAKCKRCVIKVNNARQQAQKARRSTETPIRDTNTIGVGPSATLIVEGEFER